MRHFVTAIFEDKPLDEVLPQIAGLRLELKNCNPCDHDLVVFAYGDLFHSLSEIVSELPAIPRKGVIDSSRFAVSERILRSIGMIHDVRVMEFIDLNEDATSFYLQMKALSEEYGDDSQIVFVDLVTGSEVTKIGNFD